MTKLEQAARQALEALELFGTDDMAYIKSDKAVTSLREALSEQAEQEPVVFYRCNGCGHAYESFAPSSCDCMEGTGFSRIEYYAAPVRTKDLTNDEIYKLADDVDWATGAYLGFARAVIAKFKEKNK